MADYNGTSGDDTYFGGADDDHIYGFAGKDQLSGGDGADYIEGGSDDDVINGNAGDDYTIDFNAPGYTGLFTNIENLTLTSATDERFVEGDANDL